MLATSVVSSNPSRQSERGKIIDKARLEAQKGFWEKYTPSYRDETGTEDVRTDDSSSVLGQPNLLSLPPSRSPESIPWPGVRDWSCCLVFQTSLTLSLIMPIRSILSSSWFFRWFFHKSCSRDGFWKWITSFKWIRPFLWWSWFLFRLISWFWRWVFLCSWPFIFFCWFWFLCSRRNSSWIWPPILL